jgi:tripartite-type tricarboxylate transporter receptor subunit TctC
MMNMKLWQSTLALVSLLGTFAACDPPATAQNYPARPVKIIVPYPAGGPADILARITAQKLSEGLGTQFYVENLAGASGTIGTAAASNAPPDGYTIVEVNPDFVIQPLIKAKVPYDLFKGFAPVILAASAPEMISVNPAVPAKTFKELIELLRANPGKYQFATPGVGTPPHLYGEMIYHLTYGLDVIHVPFPGAAPAVNSTVAGHTSILDITLPSHTPYVKAGTLRGIAVLSSKRSAALPEVPTLAEAGLPGQETEFFLGFAVPAGSPCIDRRPDGPAAHPAVLPRLRHRLAGGQHNARDRTADNGSGADRARPGGNAFADQTRARRASGDAGPPKKEPRVSGTQVQGGKRLRSETIVH